MSKYYPQQTDRWHRQVLRTGSWTSTQSLVFHPRRWTACTCAAQLLHSNSEADLQPTLLHLTLLEQTHAGNAWRSILHYTGSPLPQHCQWIPTIPKHVCFQGFQGSHRQCRLWGSFMQRAMRNTMHIGHMPIHTVLHMSRNSQRYNLSKNGLFKICSDS